MRIFAFQIFLVALPFVIYRLYVFTVMRRKVQSGDTYNEVPLSILFIAGLVLAGVSLIAVWATQDTQMGDYTPAKFEDGEIVPPKID